VRIDGWDISTDPKCEKARVQVPAGPPVKAVLKLLPEKAVRSGEKLTMRVSFKDATDVNQAKLPRGLHVEASVKGQKSLRGGQSPPDLQMGGLRVDQKDNGWRC
jgi:hypothetical protein